MDLLYLLLSLTSSFFIQRIDIKGYTIKVGTINAVLITEDFLTLIIGKKLSIFIFGIKKIKININS